MKCFGSLDATWRTLRPRGAALGLMAFSNAVTRCASVLVFRRFVVRRFFDVRRAMLLGSLDSRLRLLDGVDGMRKLRAQPLVGGLATGTLATTFLCHMVSPVLFGWT